MKYDDSESALILWPYWDRVASHDWKPVAKTEQRRCERCWIFDSRDPMPLCRER